jgi:serralysin
MDPHRMAVIRRASINDILNQFAQGGAGLGAGLGDDLLRAFANQIFEGGSGTATLTGTAGDDTFIVDNPRDIVIELLNQGTDLVRASVSHTLSANVENLTLTGSAAINGSGNTLNNILLGNSAANILDGGAGADHMSGGAGNDTYIIDNATDVVSELANQGLDLIRASVTHRLSANVENLTLTGTSAINGTGNGLNNIITGNSAANILNGGAGADRLIGGAGNDTYVIDSAGDVVTELANQGIDLVKSSASHTLAANVENLTLTGSSVINGTGNALNNIITGNTAANILDGGAGADHMSGGAGDDTYFVDNIGDVVIDSSGIDTVKTTLAVFTLGTGIENLTYTGTGAFVGTGNDLDNIIITGGAGNDTLNGGLGADHMCGGAGDDTYIVDNAGDVVSDSSGIDTIKTTLGVFTLGTEIENLTFNGTGNFTGTGNALNNVITSGIGNDTLNGGAGADRMFGGAGDDTYIVDDAGDVVTDSSGTDTIRTTLYDCILVTGIENAIFTGTGDFFAVGTEGSNIIQGGIGHNTLLGQGGSDTLIGGASSDTFYGTLSQYPAAISFVDVGSDTFIGGAGDDWYHVAHSDDKVIEYSGDGIDWVVSIASYVLPENVENLGLRSAEGNIDGTGNALDNIIYGNNSDNVLDGKAGADRMDGDGGDDTYFVDNYGDVTNDTGGIDTIKTSLAAFELGTGIENLTYTGTGGFTGTGNELTNIITGGDGNDTLTGGYGDSLYGGNGNDTYVVDNANVAIVDTSGIDTIRTTLLSYTLGNGFENLTFFGIWGNFTGNGNALDNTITGGAGNDTLYGDAGTDHLIGGAGDDTYYVYDLGDVVTDSSGIDVVVTSLSAYTLGADIENLTYNDTGNFTGTGNALDNIITGANGDDTLDGGAGADTMYGGTGNNIFVVDNVADVVVGGMNQDTVQTTLNTYTLGVDLEIVTFTGTGDFVGTGNDTGNIITGGSGNDILDGGAGDDGLYGGGGDDTFIVDSAYDTIADSAGTDTVKTTLAAYTLEGDFENLTFIGTGNFTGTGNDVDNVLTGGAGNDTLDGGAGDDYLDGGAGQNTLYGGDGNDTYIFENFSSTHIEDTSGNDTAVTTNPFFNFGTGVLVTFSGIENVTYLGALNVSINGDSGRNVLTSGSGSDTISGENGNDTLIGGAGNDDLTGNLTAANSYENYIRAKAVNPQTTLTYTMDVGADTFIGGAGDDFYTVSHAGDVVTEYAGEGTDTIKSFVSFTLSDNVEKLYLSSDQKLNGTGNALDNLMSGSSAADIYTTSASGILDGVSGRDILNGGRGQDHFVLHNEIDQPDLIFGFKYHVYDEPDKLRFSAVEFGNIGAIVSGVNFFSTTTHTTGVGTGPSFHYVQTTGELYFDIDGQGAVADKLIATVYEDYYGLGTTTGKIPGSVYYSDFERIA